MRVLIAEDSEPSRFLLVKCLTNWGHEPVVTEDGIQAWEALQGEDPPSLLVLDRMMPGMDGTTLCRKIRNAGTPASAYIILLTSLGAKENIVEGLEAGANDYVVKPFDFSELRARLHVGERMVQLQTELNRRVRELQEALTDVKRLKALLPICCYCKKVRDDENYWQEVEQYIAKHSGTQFSHGICPSCYERVVKTLPIKQRTAAVT